MGGDTMTGEGPNATMTARSRAAVRRMARVITAIVAVELIASLSALTLTVGYVAMTAKGFYENLGLWFDSIGFLAESFVRVPTIIFAFDAPFGVLILVEGFLSVSPIIVVVSYLAGILVVRRVLQKIGDTDE